MWRALYTSAVNLRGTMTAQETFREEYNWQRGFMATFSQRPRHRDKDSIVTDVRL